MTEFVSPMMAKPLPEDFAFSTQWVAEEKFDGHRIVVRVDDRQADLFGGRLVTAWSRYGIERALPPHIREAMAELPTGTYDGELLVPGERSYGTVVLENSSQLKYKVFDVMNLLGKDLTSFGLSAPWKDRRKILLDIFSHYALGPRSVDLAMVYEFITMEHVDSLKRHIWSLDGEGLILKNRDAIYVPSKRPKNTWYKIKQLLSAALTIVGFREGTMGPNSIIVLRDDLGCETAVKWKNYELLATIQADPDKFLGRKVRIEFQERTPDGSYRHPRWDRWEDA